MRRIFFIVVVLALLSQVGYSQISIEDNIKFVFWKIDTSEIFLNSNRMENSLKTLLNIPNDYEFRIQTIKGTKDQTRETDDLGYVHERYEQYYKGIKVEVADISTHYLNNLLVFVNGEYIDVTDINDIYFK